MKDAQLVSKFRGLAPSMAAAFPCAATFWLSYEYSKFLLRQNGPFANIHTQHVVASSFAEVC